MAGTNRPDVNHHPRHPVEERAHLRELCFVTAKQHRERARDGAANTPGNRCVGQSDPSLGEPCGQRPCAQRFTRTHVKHQRAGPQRLRDALDFEDVLYDVGVRQHQDQDVEIDESGRRIPGSRVRRNESGDRRGRRVANLEVVTGGV